MKNKSLVLNILSLVGCVFIFVVSAVALSEFVNAMQACDYVGTPEQKVKYTLLTIAFAAVLAILLVMLCYFAYKLFICIKESRHKQ